MLRDLSSSLRFDSKGTSKYVSRGYYGVFVSYHSLTFILCCRYEDGVSVLRKVSSAADFIWSDAPLDVLGSVTTISFDDSDSIPLKDHNLTTEEVLCCLCNILCFQQYFLISLIDFTSSTIWQVRALCDDLRVLGKQDFKNLLK